MLKEERQKLILEYVDKKKYCTNETLSSILNIPFTTLRRDLTDLHNQNKLVRVHGGAQSIKEKSILETKLEEKLAINIEAKQIIANKCLELIQENQTIFLDAGSTTYFLANIMSNNLNIKIYTNSIRNAQILANNGISQIYLLPGKLKLLTGAICGVETIESLNKYHFDLAFIGINAIDSENNLYTTDEDEANVKTAAIKNSGFVYGLADSSKNNSKSLIKFSNSSDVFIINEKE